MAYSCSLNAMKKGIELANDLSADVMLLCVVDMTNTIDAASVGAIIDKNIEAALKDRANGVLTDAMKKYPYGKTTKIIREGIPTEAINVIAEEQKADLIVMGTHGRTGLDHFLMGSIAEEVIRYSKIPVMVVTLSGE